MSENEPRCGLCKHFHAFKSMRDKGACIAPIPSSIVQEMVRVETMHVDGGTECEAFERKEPPA